MSDSKQTKENNNDDHSNVGTPPQPFLLLPRHRIPWSSHTIPALLAPIPPTQQEAGLPVALLVMLRRAAADAAGDNGAPAPAPAAAAPRRRGAAAAKQQSKQQQQQPREGADADEAAPAREFDWLPELAAALCDQVGSLHMDWANVCVS